MSRCLRLHLIASKMALYQSRFAIALYVQGFLLLGVGTMALAKPEAFVSGTGDFVQEKPTQLLHAMR